MTGFKSPFSIGQIVTNNEITKADLRIIYGQSI